MRSYKPHEGMEGMQDRVRFASDPSLGNIPFRGEVPLLDGDEALTESTEMVSETEVHVLDFSDEDDIATYQEACNVVDNQMGAFGYCDFQWVEEDKTWRVLITLRRYYREDKKQAKEKKLNMKTKQGS